MMRPMTMSSLIGRLRENTYDWSVVLSLAIVCHIFILRSIFSCQPKTKATASFDLDRSLYLRINLIVNITNYTFK
jgi:hypothetical protein